MTCKGLSITEQVELKRENAELERDIRDIFDELILIRDDHDWGAIDELLRGHGEGY